MSTKPYRPSNGTEGEMFMEEFCFHCARDAKFRETQDGEDGCPILADTYVYEKDDPKYPKEWVYDPDKMVKEGVLTIGGEDGARCTAFEEESVKIEGKP